jgi:hypothetical protein
MPLKKLSLKSGVNRENTRYTNEGGWYDCDKVRFRQGTPEKIGGWQAVNFTIAYLGVCRSLWPWASFLGMGTNLKYYVMYGTQYYDITPIRATTAAGDVTFAATNGSSTLVVTDTLHGAAVGDFVTFYEAVSLGGNITATVLNKEYQVVTVPTANTYTVTSAVVATAGDVGNGGTVTVGAYQISVGSAISVPFVGWGAGGWGSGTWGVGSASSNPIRIWGAQNFGQDLIYSPQGGPLYYWASGGLTTRGVAVSSLPGADVNVPLMQNLVLVSDASRFVIVFGTNDYGSIVQDPMLIRWSDQESTVTWTPAATNQAGSLRLSHGAKIVAYQQTRQEVLVWTDTSMYSMQYVGPPIVWGATLLGDNVTIISDRASVSAVGVTYWMGLDKFYQYDGRINTLKCDIRQYIFDDFNATQSQQVFASTVERFNEVWWFYCSASSTEPDKYVVFNYSENIWYYGSLTRSAWIDSSVISQYPIAAHVTYNGLMYQEYGYDDAALGTSVPITSFITSAEFDLDDGNNFSFVWRVLPDITFRGSDAAVPKATFYMLPLANSGSGYNNNTSTNSNQSVADLSYYPITRSAQYPVEQFTGQINTRVRGRQMSIKIESTDLGVSWQLGSPRLDLRPDGRR